MSVFVFIVSVREVFVFFLFLSFVTPGVRPTPPPNTNTIIDNYFETEEVEREYDKGVPAQVTVATNIRKREEGERRI